MLLRQRSSVPLDEDMAALPAPASGAGKALPRLKINAGHDEALKAALVEQAAAVRDITGVALEKGITLRELLKGGALCGQPVFFQSRQGNLTLTGASLFPCSLGTGYRGCLLLLKLNIWVRQTG